MGEEDVLMVVAVPVLREYRGNLIFIIAVLEGLGVRDIIIVGDTTILSSFLMSRIEEYVQVIAVANIGAKQNTIKMRDTLITMVASGVSVIEVKAYIDPFTGIDGKLRIDMVFTICFVSAVVIPL